MKFIEYRRTEISQKKIEKEKEEKKAKIIVAFSSQIKK